MMSKVTLAFAVAITAIAMSMPASANPKPGKPRNQTSTTVADQRNLPAPTPDATSPYPRGYQDAASNKTGW
jgi:hypothetical protein